jgi:DNA polymerase-1
MIVVTKDNFIDVVNMISKPGEYGLDTETSGLSEDDSLFSLIIAGEKDEYYFNFNLQPDIPTKCSLDRNSVFNWLKPIFNCPLNTWYIQNAKFDMRMLAKEGCYLGGKVYCTEAMERIIQNNYIGSRPYSLKALAERRGLKKDDSVEIYIGKNKLYSVKTMPGKKKRIKLPHFDRVPFSIIVPYGGQDAKLHRAIGVEQQRSIDELSKTTKFPSIRPLAENEAALTKTCFRMERRGIRLNRPYVEAALHYELNQVVRSQGDFKAATGREYKDSNKLFKEVFDACGEAYPTTEKGNASFAADVLEEMVSPAAALINKIRYHEKRAGTYYSSFLHYVDKDDILHADMRQAGTETGRFSYRDPNLQNVPKEDGETPFPVRASFIPRDGMIFHSIDYQQQEFRMMLDWAGEHALIKAVNEGADVHQATADLCGISRRQAKTINFGLLYGMGKRKLATSLGITESDANDLICTYFAKLPRVKPLLTAIARAGEARGFVFNWFGRRCHISSKDFSYVLPNHLIQGGCADVIKIAMNLIGGYLLAKKSPTAMLLQVHDELLTEGPDAEDIPKIVEIMESVYKPQNGMRLTCSIEHSAKSWSTNDKVPGPFIH